MAHSVLAEEVFARIREKATEQMAVRQEARALWIEPSAPGSFPILVQDDGPELTVAAGGWHTHFSDAEDAYNCVMWLLTPFYRIVRTERGGSIVKARLERFEPPGRWMGMEEMGVLFSWFGRKTTTVLQQNVVGVPSEFLAEFPSGVIGADGFPLA